MISKRSRCRFTAALKFQALKGEKTLVELSSRFEIQASQIQYWMNQLIENGREWSLCHESVVKQPPFPCEVGRHDHTCRLVSPPTSKRSLGLAAEILDRDGREVFMRDLVGMELWGSANTIIIHYNTLKNAR